MDLDLERPKGLDQRILQLTRLFTYTTQEKRKMTEKATSQSKGAAEKGLTIITTSTHVSKYRQRKSKNRIIRVSDIDADLRFKEKSSE